MNRETLFAMAVQQCMDEVQSPAFPPTKRELLIAFYMTVEGFTTGEVAERLRISIATVSSHWGHFSDGLGLARPWTRGARVLFERYIRLRTLDELGMLNVLRGDAWPTVTGDSPPTNSSTSQVQSPSETAPRVSINMSPAHAALSMAQTLSPSLSPIGD